MSIICSHCRHKFFNTNNLWVNLDRLKETLSQANGTLPLPLIKNKKTVNPRDSSSAPVFQLETAMGSAIECFDDAGAVVVPRERFAPVKTCGDLFILRSDAYKVGPIHLAACLLDRMAVCVDRPECLGCIGIVSNEQFQIRWKNQPKGEAG